MDITTTQFKEWLVLLSGSEFTWLVAAIFILVVYRGTVEHLLKRLIDLIFRK